MERTELKVNAVSKRTFQEVPRGSLEFGKRESIRVGCNQVSLVSLPVGTKGWPIYSKPSTMPEHQPVLTLFHAN